MNSKIITVSQESRLHDQAFHETFQAVKAMKSRHVQLRPHRSMTPMKVTPWLMIQAIGLPIVLCALLWWAKPTIIEFWQGCIELWAGSLGLPLLLIDGMGNEISLGATPVSGWSDTPLPGRATMLITAVLTLAALVLSLVMKGAMLPLKYPLRIMSVIQAAALVYFALNPTSFPYSITRHSQELINIGYVGILATPVMLGVGYYILNQRILIKLMYTTLIIMFLLIMVPHQVIMHALILQNFSVLFMPVLYICFGAVFNAIVFIALYSWAASNAPPHATL